MENRRKQMIMAVCTIIFVVLAASITFYVKKNKDQKLLLESDSEIVLQQTNETNAEEELNSIQDIEDYEEKFVSQGEGIQINGPNTYKINDDKCSVSFNSGESFKEVPLGINELCSNEGGYPYKNKLQDGSYVITPKISAIAYGGTEEIPLSIIISSDGGETWNKSIVDAEHQMKCVRVKMLSFINESCGYLIASNEKTMSVESKFIYKTTDGGKNWYKVSVQTDMTGNLIYNAGFVSEKLGFISMVSHDEPIIYRTEDGGTTFTEVKIQLKDDMAVQPSIPYVKDNKLYLDMGIQQSGEYLYGFEKSEVYESTDTGKTFH